MKAKSWSKLGSVVGAVGCVLSIVMPIIESKAAPYEEEETYRKFEERYGLTPIEKNEED